MKTQFFIAIVAALIGAFVAPIANDLYRLAINSENIKNAASQLTSIEAIPGLLQFFIVILGIFLFVRKLFASALRSIDRDVYLYFLVFFVATHGISALFRNAIEKSLSSDANFFSILLSFFNLMVYGFAVLAFILKITRISDEKTAGVRTQG
ncbi:hypothetical protein [Fulvimarina manganoxydans]|uniref:hypothetical protein n=1 Tax=Fulvimarina manganoxydans TaxID=937218 RepID=UPI0009FD7C5F|nr:hypothetical protein [Fulvimarina manganoxydans]